MGPSLLATIRTRFAASGWARSSMALLRELRYRSAAAAIPPPRTTISGSKRLTRLATAKPRSWPHLLNISSASRSCSRAAAARSRAVICAASNRDRILFSPFSSRSRAIHAMAGPATKDSNSPNRRASRTSSRVTVIHPAQPESSCAPRMTHPPLKMPAPIPVPTIKRIASDLPRAAPSLRGSGLNRSSPTCK